MAHLSKTYQEEKQWYVIKYLVKLKYILKIIIMWRRDSQKDQGKKMRWSNSTIRKAYKNMILELQETMVLIKSTKKRIKSN